VQGRFGDQPRDQANDDVPNQMKHDDISSSEKEAYQRNTPISDSKIRETA
jgi:hypothetical protein